MAVMQSTTLGLEAKKMEHNDRLDLHDLVDFLVDA